MKSGARNKPQGEASIGTLQTGQTSPMLPACSIPKPQKVQQDEERLNFVRKKTCLIELAENDDAVQGHMSAVNRSLMTGRYDNNCEAHHVRKGTGTGLSRKPDARRTIPLCEVAHREYHRIGHDTFCKKYGLDLEAHLRRINAEYDALHPKKVTKPVRKRKQKATLHIQFCAGCSHAHEIPTRKLIQERGILKFRCIQTNQILQIY